jgi:hypothetical protein
LRISYKIVTNSPNHYFFVDGERAIGDHHIQTTLLIQAFVHKIQGMVSLGTAPAQIRSLNAATAPGGHHGNRGME